MFLFDLGIGLLLTTAIAIYAGLEPSLWLLAAGIGGSILPDWDMIPYLVKSSGKLDQWAHKHRDISHYPLLTIPLIVILTGSLAGSCFAITVAVTMTAHYICDTDEIGWGVRWLYPFSKRYFAFRSVGNQPKRFHAWTPRQQDEAAAEYGDPEWAKNQKQWWHDYMVFLLGLTAAAWWYYSH